jgi:predicted esterase
VKVNRVGWLAWTVILALFSFLPLGRAESGPKKHGEEPIRALRFTLASRFPGGEGALGLAAWKRHAPGASAVTIRSSADGAEQNAFFFDPGGAAKKPLLVVLHSWSTDWRQNIGIPYAVFAAQNDWIFIHPDFRGPYRRPEAAASDLAAQDIRDAVAYAKAHASVDEDRIYLAGFSGGGMTALAMAGRHPEIWAAVVAWAPVWDMADWYAYNKKFFPKRHYASDIAAACGGAPRPETNALRECQRRSPSSLLERARAARVPVYVAHGIRDDIVPVRHAVGAFNQLADAQDRLGDELLRAITSAKPQPPSAWRGKSDPYALAAAPLHLARSSANVTLMLFEGGHDVVFDAGLGWLRDKRRRAP